MNKIIWKRRYVSTRQQLNFSQLMPKLILTLGHVYLAQGHQDKAKRSFTRARDLDILPIRAPSEINETIKSVAKETDVILADFETAFQDCDPKSVIGKPMIVEHLHPSNEGYYLIASHLTHIILKEGFLTASKRLNFEDPSLKRNWI